MRLGLAQDAVKETSGLTAIREPQPGFKHQTQYFLRGWGAHAWGTVPLYVLPDALCALGSPESNGFIQWEQKIDKDEIKYHDIFSTFLVKQKIKQAQYYCQNVNLCTASGKADSGTQKVRFNAVISYPLLPPRNPHGATSQSKGEYLTWGRGGWRAGALYRRGKQDISNDFVTGRLGGHYIPQNHLNLCPFMQRLLHIMVLWIHHTGEFWGFFCYHTVTLKSIILCSWNR